MLEWTGDAGKPKASRIVPITIYDGEKLQDAGVYLARPQPLALSYEVEYQLERNGKPFGLFDIKNAGQDQGAWVGFGNWKPMPQPKAAKAVLPEKIDDAGDDKPVLHRKKGSGDTPASTGGGKNTKPTGSGDASDPDRPKLHKKTDDTSNASPSPAPAPDSDRPVLHKPADDSAANGSQAPAAKSGSSTADSSPAPDNDRPTLKKGKPRPAADIGHVSSVPDESDPDRPRLKRGKSSGPAGELAPTLMGMPEDMQQAVAVSDARTRPEHPWTFSWANPEDEGKMKSALETMARQALGMTPAADASSAAPSKPAPRHTGAALHRTPKSAALAPEPTPLADEQFRVFELAYGAGATIVLTASDGEPLPQRKFVTLVAQPDLYGNARVLLKTVTDMAHLDEKPRMRLVDAVDALADNRAELLFELRGDGTRQFALYRVYRGSAEQLFVSGGEPYTASTQ